MTNEEYEKLMNSGAVFPDGTLFLTNPDGKLCKIRAEALQGMYDAYADAQLNKEVMKEIRILKEILIKNAEDAKRIREILEGLFPIQVRTPKKVTKRP